MNDLRIFEKEEFGAIRVSTSENNEPLFCLADVCKVLDLGNVSQVKSRLSDGVISNEVIKDSMGRNQQATFITEEALYDVIFDSRKPEAKQFRKWVTSEVLPSIRKNGMYATDVTIDKMIADPDFAIKLLVSLKEEREAKIEAEKKNAILMHSNKLYNTTEISKELGMKSAMELNNKLKDKGIQFKSNNTWVLYSKYADCGYVSIKQEILENGSVIYDRKWTQLGRDFIINLFNNGSQKNE